MDSYWPQYEQQPPAAPTPYLQPPEKKRGGFWKIATGVVLVGVVALVVWTVATRGIKKSEDSTASALDPIAIEEPAPTAAPDATADLDGDGLTQADEETYGTNPNDSDTDKDGYLDGAEVQNGYNPNGAGRLSIEAPTEKPTTEDPNRRTLATTPTVTGVPLETVYSGKGSYLCQVTGGTVQENTVTVKVKDSKVRQETPIDGSTLVMIVIDRKDFYLSGFEGGKYFKMTFNPSTGVASGEGSTVKGGIFATPALVLASGPKSINCEEATLGDAEFVVSAEQIVNPT
jgi:hypothetical protein